MPDYSKGKIYKIVSKDASHDLAYIGSTCQDLRVRLGGHKVAFKRWKDGKIGKVQSFDLFEKGEVDIILIESFPCKTKEELHARERYFIEGIVCVNKYIPCRTQKEYFEANKDDIKKAKKAYWEANKDHIKKEMKEYREANKDKFKKYYEANKDEFKAHNKKYYEANKDSIKIKAHRKTNDYIKDETTSNSPNYQTIF